MLLNTQLFDKEYVAQWKVLTNLEIVGSGRVTNFF